MNPHIELSLNYLKVNDLGLVCCMTRQLQIYTRIYHWERKVQKLDMIIIISHGSKVSGELRKPYGKKDGIRDRKSSKIGNSFFFTWVLEIAKYFVGLVYLCECV